MNKAPDLKAIKEQVRAQARAAVAAMSQQQKADESLTVCARILRSERYKRARVVMIYAPLPDEPQMDVVARDALLHGKTLLLPRVNWHDGTMAAAMVQAWPGDLERDSKGLLSPRHDAFTYEPLSIHLVVVPGVAFSLTGVRLGRGGGYYDRFLPPVPISRRVGVCFRCQVVQSIPLEPQDEPVAEVVYP